MDDVWVFGRNQEQHDVRLATASEKIRVSEATLNPEKCELRKTKLTFLGHIIDERGIHADQEKSSELLNMSTPTNISELKRSMGMANQQGKFSRNLAELTQPLRQLLSKKHTWLQGPAQEQAFAKVKEELTKPTVFALYDPEALNNNFSQCLISWSRCSHVGKESIWKPGAYTSWAMTETECHYVQNRGGTSHHLGL